MLTARQVTQLHTDGYCAVTRVSSTAEAAQLRAMLESLYSKERPATGIVMNCRRREPELTRMAVYARCLAIARQVLGTCAFAAFDSIVCKPPHEHAGTLWHQDQAYDLVYRAAVAPMHTLHFWIPLQHVTAHNGCLHYIPGSHGRVLPHRLRQPGCLALDHVDTAAAVPCPMPIGSVVMHYPTTIHCATPNQSDQPRMAWTIHFRRPAFRDMLRLVPNPVMRLCRHT